MLFSTPNFLYVFLPVLLAIYWIFYKNPGIQLIVLTVFSLYFYAFGEPVYVFLMIGLVLANYYLGKACAGDGESEQPLSKKLLLCLAVAVNLSGLVFFKYTNFICENINALTGLSLKGISLGMPIGISFFTFQSMSYVIDAYRGTVKVQKSYVKLLLYVSFFPQLIAGPIVRYQDIEEQLENRSWSINQINDGIFRFALGLAKKVLIADSCDAVVNSLGNVEEGTFLLGQWMKVIFYTLQLYFDFSGYSDMAIGLGKLFGFDFPENFNYPFASKSITEYWRRWHITLGTWFKDYLFYPVLNSTGLKKLARSLMKKKKRKLARYLPNLIALLVVWLATGIWHGASWNFVLWGIYYYLWLAADMVFLDDFRKKLPKIAESFFSHGIFIVATFFGMALFFFEDNTLSNLGSLFGAGVCGFTTTDVNAIICQNLWLLLAALVLSVPTVPKLYSMAVRECGITPAADRVIKTAVSIIFLGLATTVMVAQTYSPFLYFRF